jgi:hypothetical protein
LGIQLIDAYNSNVVRPILRLRELLPKNIRVDLAVLRIICRDYSARLLTCENEELAVRLYTVAERTMRSATREFLRTTDFIIVDGVFSAAISSKASFYKAFDEGRPVMLKVYHDSQRTGKELSLLHMIEEKGSAKLETFHLVPVARKTIKVRDVTNLTREFVNGSSSFPGGSFPRRVWSCLSIPPLQGSFLNRYLPSTFFELANMFSLR